MSTLRSIFTERLESVGGTAHWCRPDEVATLVIEASRAFPDRPVIYTKKASALLPELVPELERAGLSCVAARSIDDALACPVALSAGELAVAETGTVLVAERDLGQRAPGMLATTDLILVAQDRLVADLDAAGEWLQRHVCDQPYVSFMTGPSRTADIQRTLTIGVQGPRDVMVVFVSDEL